MALKNIRETFDVLSTSKWDNWGGAQCVASDGALRISTTLTANYYGIEIKDWQSLIDSEVSIQLVDAGNTSLASYEVIPIELIITSTANQVGWYISGGNLLAVQKVASVQTNLSTVAYNSSVHKFLRIRESGGTTYWDYSTDGLIWTNSASNANPIDLTLLKFNIVVGCYSIEATTTTAVFDNINVLPQQIKNPNIRPYPFSPCRAR